MKCRINFIVLCAVVFFLTTAGRSANEQKTGPANSLESYLKKVKAEDRGKAVSYGSLWSERSDFADLTSDRKAKNVGDLIVIRITEQTVAGSSGSVSTSRKFSADSGLQALAGQINTKGVSSLFSPSSNAALNGKGATSTTSNLSTSVAGQVVGMLPNGNLVIEANRQVTMNRERQHIWLRGVVRRGDIGADDSVSSSAISDFEVEVQGKGVISDATRSPNRIVRGLLWLVGF